MKKTLLILLAVVCLSFTVEEKPKVFICTNLTTYDNILQTQFTKPINICEKITIPLKRAGNLILIEAQVDSLIGNFIFDTGAPGLVLNKTYFRNYQKVYNSGEAGISGINNQHLRKRIKHFKIGTIEYKKLNADVTELGHIENKRGVKILGLIGASFLEDFEAIIDLRKSVMHLMALDRKGETISQEKKQLQFSQKLDIKFSNNVICLRATIGSKNISFCLDTGAETNVLDISSNKQVLETVSITKRVEVSGASSQKVEVFYGLMNDFNLGNLNIPQMHVMLTDLSNLRKVYGVNIYGMLGYDFFKQGLISINLRKKELKIMFYEEAKR